MTLTDYDSDEDADYDPVYSEEDSEAERSGVHYDPTWGNPAVTWDCPCGRWRQADQTRCQCGNTCHSLREKGEGIPIPLFSPS